MFELWMFMQCIWEHWIVKFILEMHFECAYVFEIVEFVYNNYEVYIYG